MLYHVLQHKKINAVDLWLSVLTSAYKFVCVCVCRDTQVEERFRLDCGIVICLK